MDHGVATLAADPGFLLSRVGAAVQAGFKGVLARWGLRPLHFLLLTVLDGAGGVSQQQLCRRLAIDSGNMVELLDRLEGTGLAARARDPADRRRHLVTLTPAGRRTLAAIRAAAAQFTVEFFEPLSADECERLIGSLAKLYAATPEGRREAPPVGLAPAAEGGGR